MNYKIENIRKIDRGYVKASFDLIVGPFIIKDFLFFRKEDREWISSPSRKYKDSEGSEKYFSYVRCQDKEKWESFSNWAVDIVSDKIGATHDSPPIPEDDDIPF